MQITGNTKTMAINLVPNILPVLLDYELPLAIIP
jgi:hypothetical protein